MPEISCDVVVVGGGPVGLLSAILIAKGGADVIVVEREKEIVPSPRAIVYHAPTLVTLDKAGILEDARKAGKTPNSMITWRRSEDHSLIGEMDENALHDDDKPAKYYRAPVLLGQHRLAAIIHDHLEKMNAKLYYGHNYEHLEQKNDKVIVTTTDSKGEKHNITAKFVVAADGGRSPVRKELGIERDGYTHDLHFVAVNFKYDKMYETGFTDVQFMVDPKDDVADSRFAVIIRTGSEDVWRCAYGDSTKFTEEEVLERLPARLKTILPLNPDPEDYEILQAVPYRIHQRVAKTYVKGRVILAGDAAHLNNPIGGIGLNTGLCDAHVVGNTILEALKLKDEKEIAATLQAYSDVRRKAFNEYTNPNTIAGLKILLDNTEEGEKERKHFFEGLKDPKFQRQMQLDLNKMAGGAEWL